jgi:hypothetical protein
VTVTALTTIILVSVVGFLFRARNEAEAPAPEPIATSTVRPVVLTEAPQEKEGPGPGPVEPDVAADVSAVAAPVPAPKAAMAIQPGPAPRPDPPRAGPGDNTGAPIEPVFDLRGPVPKIGFTVRERTKVTGSRTSTLTRPRARPVTERSDLVHDIEKVYTVTNVLNDKVCEYETKVITGDITLRDVDATGKRRTSDQLDDFVGETIGSMRLRAGWSHALIDQLATDKQQPGLRQLRPFFQDREFVPAGGQKTGASWDVDRDYIDILIRTTMSAVSGKVKATFARVVDHEGEQCALIEYDGRLRGSVKFGANPEAVGSILIAMTSLRSLKHGIDVKTQGNLRMESAHTTMVRGTSVEFRILAQVAIDSSFTVEE